MGELVTSKSKTGKVIVARFGYLRRAWGWESVGIFVGETPEKSQNNNEKIKSKRPVADVVQIIFDSFFDGRIASPAVYLGPSSDADL